MAVSKEPFKIVQWGERENSSKKCKCFDSNLKNQNDCIKTECLSK